MADSFVENFWRGMNLGHVIENDRRVGEAQKRQAALQQMQMASEILKFRKMAEELQGNANFKAAMQDQPNPNVGKPMGYEPDEQNYGANVAPIDRRTTVPSQTAQEIASAYLNPNAAMMALKMGRMDLLKDLPTKKEPTASYHIVADPNNPGKFIYANVANGGTYEAPVPASLQPKSALKVIYGPNGATQTVEATPGYVPPKGWSLEAPKSPKDTEAADLTKEQKRDLIVQRKLKLKIGALPQLNNLTGEMIYPANPATGKPFTQQEWATEYRKAYEDVRPNNTGAAPIKSPVSAYINKVLKR